MQNPESTARSRIRYGRHPPPAAEPFLAAAEPFLGAEASHEDDGERAMDPGPWLAGLRAAGYGGGEFPDPDFPAGRRRTDLRVLFCGGVATAAAFAAAFFASGGALAHPAVTATVPAAVSPACPAVAP
jgi:hypothetical protein